MNLMVLGGSADPDAEANDIPSSAGRCRTSPGISADEGPLLDPFSSTS